jgi:hypothetical protein
MANSPQYRWLAAIWIRTAASASPPCAMRQSGGMAAAARSDKRVPGSPAISFSGVHECDADRRRAGGVKPRRALISSCDNTIPLDARRCVAAVETPRSPPHASSEGTSFTSFERRPARTGH